MIVERDSSIKLLGVWIDENLTLGGEVGGWGVGVEGDSYSYLFKIKLQKNIEHCLKQIFFGYVHAHINYPNTT